MKIVLARHGKPKLDQRSWITPRELPDWLRGYNDSEVFADGVPSVTATVAAESAIIVSSPLLRCVQSALLLAPSREITTEKLFHEAGIPYALWAFPRLPLAVWAVLFRTAWFWGYSSNSESLALAKIRAHHAAERLIELAKLHESVFVMGHGIFTALMAKQLVERGWIGPKRPAHRYWQYSVYRFSN
jgi:broad specificity phosphatase PhoE